MGGNLVYERYHWFDRQVREGVHPNATSLARRFEVSTKTAARAIEFMRERLGAPLEYDPSEKGYRYTDGAFRLPPLVVSQEELVAVLAARSLLTPATVGPVARGIRSLEKKLRIDLGGAALTQDRFDRILSSSWAGYAPAPDPVFRTVLGALLEDRPLRLLYRAPDRSTATPRTVEPHHLQFYLGTWVLLAFCRLQDQWRTFALSRVEQIEQHPEPFTPRSPDTWRPLIDDVFGVFQGEARLRVTLRFSPARAPWVREQVWHPDQRQIEQPDGGLDLTFPVADLREVTMKVLSFGADVTVLEPDELRHRVEAEVEKMWRKVAKNEKNPDIGRRMGEVEG